MPTELNSVTQQLKIRMAAYIKSFYSADPEIQIGIKTKEEHTGFVTRHARDLAAALGLCEHDVNLAEIIGLLHDIGRFHQYTIYKTFNDSKSEDHGDLAVKYLREMNYLEDLSAADRELVLFAIQNHNKRFIAPTEDERKILFAKIARDADKLDIYRVLNPFLSGEKKREVANFMQVDPSDTISPDFIRHFQNGEQANYNEIHTQGDRRVVRLLWIYDIYFGWTMRQIVSAGYIDRIIDELGRHHTGELQEGIDRLHRFVADKCAEQDRIGKI